MTHALGKLLSLLFHRDCHCGRRVESAWFGARCGHCWSKDRKLAQGSQIRCRRCDLPLQLGSSCPDCRELEPGLGRVVSAGLYTGEWKKRIREIKFQSRNSLRRPLQRALLKKTAALNGADLVIEVPAASERPGMHLATELADAVSKKLGSLRIVNPLSRRPGHVRQASLDGKNRRSNARGAFACHSPWLVEGKKILLVDDVMTTGSTLQACSKALLDAGAKEVNAVVLARSPQKHMKGALA